MTSSDWIALAALGVAGLVALLNYLNQRHARSESYRGALYASQMSCIGELLRASGELQRAARAIALRPEGAKMPPLVKDFDDATASLAAVLNSGAGVLPRRVLEASKSHFQALVMEALVTPSRERADRQKPIQDAWTKLVEEIRKEMGADALGAEVRRLIGVPDDDRIDALLARHGAKQRELARLHNPVPRD